MVLEKKHKWLIGSFTSIVIIFMIVSGILIAGIIAKQTQMQKDINEKIDGLQADTQNKFNELTSNLIETKNSLQSLNTQVSSIDKEFNALKSSVSADFSGIIEDAVKSVVTIKTNVGQGTGFIISDDGYIVTNAHVLADSNGYLAQGIKAVTSEQVEKSATFIGYNSNLDLALLKIGGTYQSIELGNSDDLKIGEKVIAIGNPLGLQFSVSEGIISAINRDVASNGLPAYIQTDAALNPGNSGGPLINKEGKVVGINNFKISSGESLGFALESNYIKEAVNNIANEKLNRSLI